MGKDKTQPYIVFAGLSLALLFVYLWIWGIQDYYFTQDNAFHILLAKRISWDIQNDVRMDTHPPLYYLLLQIVIRVLGTDNPVILRSVSLLSGLSTVILAFVFGRKVGRNALVGLFLAYIVVTAPLFILQGQVIRNYSLLVCVILSLFFCFQKKRFESKDWGIAILLIVLLTFSHYVSLVFLPSLFVAGIFKIKKDLSRGSTLAVLFVWALFLMMNAVTTYWMISLKPEAISGADFHIANLRGAIQHDLLKVGPVLFGLLKSCFGTYTFYIIISLLVLGVVRLVVEREFQFLFLSLGTLFMGILLSFLGKYPLNSSRHSLYLFPVFLVPITWALSWIFKKKPLALGFLFGLILTLQLMERPGIYQVADWRAHQPWELGPKQSEIRNVLQKVGLELGEDNEALLLDWDLGMSYRLEKLISPPWGVFLDFKRPIDWCQFSLDSKIPTCECLKTKWANQKINLLVYGGRVSEVSAVRDHGACFEIAEKKPVSRSYVLMTLKYLPQKK